MYGGRLRGEDRGYRTGVLTSTASGAGTEWGRLVESTAALSQVAAAATTESTAGKKAPGAAGESSCSNDGERTSAFGSMEEKIAVKAKLSGTQGDIAPEQHHRQQLQPPQQQIQQPQPQPQPPEKKRPPALETTPMRALPVVSGVRKMCPLVGMVDMLESPRGDMRFGRKYATFTANRLGRSSQGMGGGYSPKPGAALGILPANFLQSNTASGAQEEQRCGVDLNGVVWHAENCVLRQKPVPVESRSIARSAGASLSLSPKSDATSGNEVAGEAGEIVVPETRLSSCSPDLTRLRSGSRCSTEDEGVRCNHWLGAIVTVLADTMPRPLKRAINTYPSVRIVH